MTYPSPWVTPRGWHRRSGRRARGPNGVPARARNRRRSNAYRTLGASAVCDPTARRHHRAGIFPGHLANLFFAEREPAPSLAGVYLPQPDDDHFVRGDVRAEHPAWPLYVVSRVHPHHTLGGDLGNMADTARRHQGSSPGNARYIFWRLNHRGRSEFRTRAADVRADFRAAYAIANARIFHGPNRLRKTRADRAIYLEAAARMASAIWAARSRAMWT